MTKSIHTSSHSSLHSISNKLTLVNEDRKKTSVLIKHLKNFFNLNILNPLTSHWHHQSELPHNSPNLLIGHQPHQHHYQPPSVGKTTHTTTNTNNIEISIDLTAFRAATLNANNKLHLSLNQEKYVHYLNYYYQINYHQNIIYYNNLLLALIILFVLFSLLILLEENETFYNLSAITFLLLVTFNLIILIFSHNLTKQFLVHKSYLNY